MERFLFLLAFVFVSLAFPSFAFSYEVLDDPLLTPGDETDRVIISAVTTSVDAPSVGFGSQGNTRLLLKIVVSACAACNFQPQLQYQEADGAWAIYAAFTALTADGTVRYLVEKGTVLGTDDITTDLKVDLPGRWRLLMFRLAGSATIVASGVSW